MSIASQYPFSVSIKNAHKPLPRFSLTSDVLSFRRCEKQYGAFGHDGFVPARATQAFFGSVIHQVLDLCHRQFDRTGSLATDAEIDTYFTEVESALRSHGVRAASGHVADTARELLKRFNSLEGAALYSRVKDTEFRLESERPNYILRGVVDVLATDKNDPDNPAKMEIWDYKGSKRPPNSDKRLKEYEWQMAVYAELFKQKAGCYPKQAVLYFLNELSGDPPPTSRPLRAAYVVQFDPASVARALKEFDKTADEIMACQQKDQWPDPKTPPDKETCDICDLRWNCKVPKTPYKDRLPIVE